MEAQDVGLAAARKELITRQQERRAAARIPENLMDCVRRATSHCQGSSKVPKAPPLELFCQDNRGRRMKEELDLRDFSSVSNEWLVTIAAHAVAKGVDGATRCRRLLLAGTSITDAGVAHLQKLKYLTTLDISRCDAITDEGLMLIRKHLNLLQELHLDDCRHFSGAVLCKVWKDCKRLHSLSLRGCPGVTDAVLQCLATTTRSSAQCTIRALDVRHCKNLTSSGISYLASSSVKGLAIQHLALGDCLGVDNMAFFGFETSMGLQSLTSLNLCGLCIDETAISWIVKGSGASLQCLNLSRCKALSDFALLLMAPLMASPTFVKLSMHDCPLVTDTGIKNLFSVEEEAWLERGSDEDDDDVRGHLVSLNLKNCTKVGDDALVYVGKFGASLEKLDLKGLRKVSDRGVAEIAKGCPSLTTLALSGRHLTVQAFRLLGKMCRKLHTLHISERQDLATPECFLHLTPAVVSVAVASQSLKCINLTATNVCDTGVGVIAAGCRQLEWISLSKCTKITDFATEALASSCFQLEVLLLANTRGITDRTLEALALTKIPLRVLDICGNTRVTDAGLLTLCTACQQIEELRLKGCDRLSPKAVKHCNDQLLPFTKPFVTASLIKTIATGGGNAAVILEPLPKPHLVLLRMLQERYESSVTLQTRFRKWRQKEFTVAFLARRRLVRETRAAKKIQACVRDFLAWRRCLQQLSLERNVDKIVFVQAHARGNRARHQVRTWRYSANRAARRIQHYYRPHYISRMRVRNFHASQIQRVYRGFRGRQEHMQLVYERKLAATAQIWRWYRKCRNHRDFLARSRWLVDKIHRLQGQWRKYKRKTNFTKYMAFYRGNAIQIQSVWRRKLAKWHVSAMRIEMNAAARTIQCVFRGHVVRRRVAFYRTLATNTATVIQTQWRRYSARKAYLFHRRLVIHVQKKLRYAWTVRKWRQIVGQALTKHREEAALCIQRSYRGMLGRKRALLFCKIRKAKLACKGQDATHALLRRRFMRKGAVLCVQQWVRRMLARRRMLKVRRWRRFLAAQSIQRYLKAWMRTMRLSRKREAKLHAALNIQRVFRGYQGRAFFKKERYHHECQRAAQLIQRVYRGHLGRKLHARVLKEKAGAARLLQRAYRSRQARKFYEISKAMAALKAKEQHDRSLLGRLDARRNPMDELYRRAKLPREKEVLTQLKDKWEAHRVVEERAVRKIKRECAAAWGVTDEIIGNQYAVRRKLYGVTENVYATRRQLEKRTELRSSLEQELAGLHDRVRAFKRAMREAVAAKRMLEGEEVFELLKEQGLFMELAPQPARLRTGCEI